MFDKILSGPTWKYDYRRMPTTLTTLTAVFLGVQVVSTIHVSPTVQQLEIIPDSPPKSDSDRQPSRNVYGDFEIGGQVSSQYQLSLIRVDD